MTARQKSWTGMNWCRKDLRLAIGLRDGMACMWCGATLEDGIKFSLDHIIPDNRGGSNRPDNLVWSCSRCNSARGDRDAAEFVSAAAGYLDHGITGASIMDAINEHLKTDIRPYRAEAKKIIARRPTWQAALTQANEA